MKHVLTGISCGFAILLLALGVNACSTITSRVAPDAAKAINRYCQEPLQERLTLRQTVNGMIAPNKVAISCAGDPP